MLAERRTKQSGAEVPRLRPLFQGRPPINKILVSRKQVFRPMRSTRDQSPLVRMYLFRNLSMSGREEKEHAVLQAQQG